MAAQPSRGPYSDHPGRSSLTQPVFTTRQLAELVTSAKFKIST
ncbi:hypothetical protein [Kribbella sp. NPDC049227]